MLFGTHQKSKEAHAGPPRDAQDTKQHVHAVPKQVATVNGTRWPQQPKQIVYVQPQCKLACPPAHHMCIAWVPIVSTIVDRGCQVSSLCAAAQAPRFTYLG